MDTMITRPSIHELLKEAMDGTVSRVAVTAEAHRQMAGGAPPQQQEKTASVIESDPPEYYEKLAEALEWSAEQFLKQANGPSVGNGPGALTVTEVASKPALPPSMGHAHHQPPMNPPSAANGPGGKGPATGLQTNVAEMPKPDPDPMGKSASALGRKNAEYFAKIAGKADMAKEFGRQALHAAGKAKDAVADKAGKAVSRGKELVTGSRAKNLEKSKDFFAPGTLGHELVGHATKGEKARVGLTRAGIGAAAAGATAVGVSAAAGKGKEKKAELAEKNRAYFAKLAGAPEGDEIDQLIAIKKANAAQLLKEAEDRINPAQISAGAAEPPPATETGQGVPSEPGDVTSQKGMISSNQAAINYTKGQAKADPKSDLGKILTEPALSSATDSVLQNAFAATGQAGVKIASKQPTTLQVAAATTLLSKMASEVMKDKTEKGKEKKSAGAGSDLSTPSGQSGFSASGGM